MEKNNALDPVRQNSGAITKEVIEDDSGLLLQGVRGCLWPERASIRQAKNAWLVPEAPQDLFKRNKICNEKN
jgi:hypothetical protein